MELVGDNGLKILSKHAVSKDKLVQKVKELLGITDKKTEKPKDRIDTLRDAAKDMAKANPEPFINTSSDSTIPAFKFTEIAAFEVSTQPKTVKRSIFWLHPGGDKIKISRQAYKSIFIYAKISDLVYLYEHPAETKAIVAAYGKATYQNKSLVLRGFLKDVSLSALIGEKVPAKEEPKGQEDGNCEEDTFESCVNGFTAKYEETAKLNCRFCVDKSRFEDRKKRASVPP